jgi:AraC-like DNA-binding protein
MGVAIALQQELLDALHLAPCVEWPQYVTRFVAGMADLECCADVTRVILASLVAQLASPVPRRNGSSLGAWLRENLSGETKQDLLRQFEASVKLVCAPAHSARSFVEDAKRLIERHYSQRLTLKSLADAVGRDRAYLAVLFRRATGQTVHGYVTAVRMRHAVRRLAEGEKVEAVIVSVGYRSKKSFYQCFRATTGLTPGKFRTSLSRLQPDRRAPSPALRGFGRNS